MAMLKRGKLRRKVVLPVTVIRRSGEEKQLAHTLDVTESSARLGGLSSSLDPGEIIEIQRGGVKAKFQVYWIGEPASTLSGQAGIRGVDPNKSIWGIQLPPDQPDFSIDMREVRSVTVTSAASGNPGEKVRYDCSAGITLRAPGSNYPVRVQLKNIHLGGVYVEASTTLPVNTVVSMDAKIEGIHLDMAGIVHGSTARVGMDIAFHKISAENQRRIVLVLQKLKQKAWDEQQVPAPPHNLIATADQTLPAHFLAASNGPESMSQATRLDACRILVTLCQSLAADFDHWKSARSAGELAELRHAVAELQKKLATAAEIDEMGYLAASGGSRS
ncbi:MAG TPA: hypothetical protein VH724_08970 [Candidatus Angelobacter sp.]|nr:hypothetical protein [Candidatus Angelobacter sp.]